MPPQGVISNLKGISLKCDFTTCLVYLNKDDYRSQSGYIFCLNGGAVGWKISKQDTIADSTTESEYLYASEAAKEAV